MDALGEPSLEDALKESWAADEESSVTRWAELTKEVKKVRSSPMSFPRGAHCVLGRCCPPERCDSSPDRGAHIGPVRVCFEIYGMCSNRRPGGEEEPEPHVPQAGDHAAVHVPAAGCSRLDADEPFAQEPLCRPPEDRWVANILARRAPYTIRPQTPVRMPCSPRTKKNNTDPALIFFSRGSFRRSGLRAV